MLLIALDCSVLVLFEQSEEAWAVQASQLWYCLPVLASNVDLIYVVVKDTFNRYIYREVERRAAQISPEYAAGGVEYYEKVMQINIALRKLEGAAPGTLGRWTWWR